MQVEANPAEFDVGVPGRGVLHPLVDRLVALVWVRDHAERAEGLQPDGVGSGHEVAPSLQDEVGLQLQDARIGGVDAALGGERHGGGVRDGKDEGGMVPARISSLGQFIPFTHSS